MLLRMKVLYVLKTRKSEKLKYSDDICIVQWSNLKKRLVKDIHT
jgi:hypothetical protein